jgi:hypothetical protein
MTSVIIIIQISTSFRLPTQSAVLLTFHLPSQELIISFGNRRPSFKEGFSVITKEPLLSALCAKANLELCLNPPLFLFTYSSTAPSVS